MNRAAPTSDMVVVQGVGAVREQVAAARRDGAAIAFVPTMGALHAGHERLLGEARRNADFVVASCYVNPTQFGPGEDLDRYPRTEQHDRDACARCGVDLLWLPGDRDIYGGDPQSATRIDVGPIGTMFEGASRPGHFDGVATVVVRLLGAVRPDELLLGRKDYQQLVVLRKVLSDLLLPIRVRAVETVREADGLAMSSRNAYLSPAERHAARSIPRALEAARHAVAAGNVDAARLVEVAQAEFVVEPLVTPDYVEVVHEGTLDRAERITPQGAAILVAARVGSTRLLDNAYLPDPAPRREARP